LNIAPSWDDASDTENDQFGFSVATAGDVNGDGYSDIIVGAYGYDSYRGKVYVYYGSAGGLGDDEREPDWFAMGEYDADEFGYSVAAAGDVNGDGYSDVIVGATGYLTSTGSTGKVYVYHGSAEGLGASGRAADWSATGENAENEFGISVATAGDVNADGYADVVVGATGYLTSTGSTGKVYVYHGSAGGLDDDREPDWFAIGENDADGFGYSVATAGDANGDGYADLVVGAPNYDEGGLTDRGKAYVYQGSADGLGDNNRESDWSAMGENTEHVFGYSVAPAGDVNGDGYGDVIVGAPGYNNWQGKVFVYHGSALGLDVPFSVFSGKGAGQEFGASVATAGDVNGDGYADIVVSEPFGTSMGRNHVYHGSAAGVGTSPAFSVGWGEKVAPAGDVNGDGYADIVVGVYTWYYNRGGVNVYQGNDGGARPGAARQVRGDVSGRAVQPWGPSYIADSFGVRLRAVHPLGTGRARLQVQACPAGVPFGYALCREETSDDWIEVPDAGGVELKMTVGGLDEGTLYRWRARALYDSPLYSHGPWRRVTAQAQEGDVRVTRLTADLAIAKTMTPAEPVGSGEAITYTLTFDSNGPARGVVITDLLSSELAVTEIISSGAAITDTGHLPCCVWRVQDLEAGQGGVITITGLAQVDRYANTAIITGTSPEGKDNLANNSATVQTHVPGILYVDGDARGAKNGLSWASAYTDLQDALDEAQAGDQIWIAEGTYRPTSTEGTQRSSTFGLKSGVALHGGFAGTEVWLHERDPASHPTILSGDIDEALNPDDNVYHVVTSTLGVTGTAVLEGLTISGGNANGTGTDGLGGGLYSAGGSLKLLNVTVVDNAADVGGGSM
jgi:hypothetical protein